MGLAWKTRVLREFDEKEALIEKNKTKNNRNNNQDVEGVGGGGSGGGTGGEEAKTKADDVWSKRIYNGCIVVKISVVISTVASIA